MARTIDEPETPLTHQRTRKRSPPVGANWSDNKSRGVTPSRRVTWWHGREACA
jgi:hypothetical protein